MTATKNDAPTVHTGRSVPDAWFTVFGMGYDPSTSCNPGENVKPKYPPCGSITNP